MIKKKYGLWTAIAMIVGIVVGSGIFFKSDNILSSTGGNVWMAVGAFLISAISIIFGAITISRLALLSSKPGGAVSYFEQFISPKMGAGFGWFQTFVYFPTLCSVIGYVSGIYICMLFGIPSTVEYQMLVGFCIVALLYVLNITLPKASGILQIACMVAKLFPLIVIAGYGIFMGDNAMSLPPEVALDYVPSHGLGLGAFVAAMLPIVFSYDGWIVATSISQEIKNEKKNLTIALLIAPTAVLVIYVLYFVGLVRMVGVEHIITSGDTHLYFASEMIFGPHGKSVIVAFVATSVIGTLNGLVLGHIRLPNNLSKNKLLGIGERAFVNINPKLGTQINSGILTAVITFIWFAVNYLVTKFNLLQGSDISELAIVSQYIMFLALYYSVFKLWRSGKIKGVGYGVICPALASIGSVIIFFSGFANPLVFIVGILIVAIVAGTGAYIKHGKDTDNGQDSEDDNTETELLVSHDMDYEIDIIESDESANI